MNDTPDGASPYYRASRIVALSDDALALDSAPAPRVLLFSLRNLSQWLAHGGLYEFEDVIMSIDSVRLLAPRARRKELAPVGLGRRWFTSMSERLGLRTLPRLQTLRVEGSYDLFFANLLFLWEVSYLGQIKEWRERSKKAICFIAEQWLPALEGATAYLQLLADFDHVFVFSRWSIPQMRATARTNVDYLPFGTDALAFCPGSAPPARTIDVLSIGRRHPAVHEVFLRLMAEDRLTYVFDSLSGFVNLGGDKGFDYREHRALVRHLIKRSCYFLAFRQNDSPPFRARTAGEEAIPSRFFESLPGGPVILGTSPDCDDFRANFDWPDAVITLPFDHQGIVGTLRDLAAQPERLARVRAHNMLNALRRHDWVFRWRTILRAARIPELPRLTERIQHLNGAVATLQSQAHELRGG